MTLHRFATLVATATFGLILAGGMVTSTGSGLAVPDWPTSYGYSMIGFPLSKMVGGIFYEHGHRLIASTVGCLMIVLALWLWRSEPRRWVRRLAALALGVVVLQGMLGGITVLLLLPAAVSTGHAALAQVFFCLTVTLALVTSPGWSRETSGHGDWAGGPSLRRMAIVTTAVIYLQILIGAVMRHTGAGLAIPDFPLVFGGLLPPYWNAAIAIHFAHRVGAAIVAAIVARLVWKVATEHRSESALRRPAIVLASLVCLQIALGGWTVLSGRLSLVNTAHVGTGALMLATSLVLTLRAFEPLIAGVSERGRTRTPVFGRSSEVRA